jgi:hypothetical protein
MDEGSGTGTAVRPIMAANNASAGAWTTFANVDKDIANLLGGMEAKGYPKSECIVVYPKAFSPVMMLHLSEFQGRSIEEYINTQCRGAIAIPDDYLPTDLGGTPTAPAVTDSDIFAIHPPSVVIGYTRRERVRVIPPFGTTRETTVEFETWPCPVFIPKPFVSTTVGATTTTYYKGVGMIDGAANA